MAKLTQAQRERKNARERERRAAKRYAETLGITPVKGESLESLYSRIDKEQRRIERNARRRAKYNETKKLLEESGLSKDIIARNKLRNKSPDTVKKFIEKQGYFTSKQWMAILYFDKSGESHIGHSLNTIRGWNMQDKYNAIRETGRNKKRLRKMNDSSAFAGDYHLIVGSEAEVKAEFERARQLPDYEVLLPPTNKFTLEGFANIMASVNAIVVPWRQASFYDEMETFAHDNLPEIHKTIF